MCAPAFGGEVSSRIFLCQRCHALETPKVGARCQFRLGRESVLLSLKYASTPGEFWGRRLSVCGRADDWLQPGRKCSPARLRRPRRATARVRRLYWRAGNRAVRAEDATIARLRPQQGPATRALVEVDACIGRHRFALPMPTGGTSQFALEKRLGHHCATPPPEHLYVGKVRTG